MIDLAPTFAALAHATPQVTVDGQPIVVRDGLGRKPPDRTLLIQAGVTNLSRSPDGWWFRGVRTRRYTYVAWTSGFRELYDRRRDPYELRNLAGHARYAKIQHALSRRTTALGSCAGDACRRVFPDLPAPLRPRDVNRERAARASS
jgi:arylsulfatase A-like enzyme